MSNIKAIFVNKKDVLDSTKEQHYIYTDIMNQQEKKDLNEFTDDSFLIIPYEKDNDPNTIFYIILRDTNVNCEAFFNGIYGLYTIINQIDPGILDYIEREGIDIILNEISSVEDYLESDMIDQLFSIIFNGGRHM